jgi:glycosyltransferase involved in cell wall biosynthesis
VKILVLSNLYPPDIQGGYELGCAQLVDALEARGHEVLVAAAAPRQPVPPARHVQRVFRLVDEWNPNAIGTVPLVVALNTAASRLVSAQNVHALTQVVDGFGPDVVLVSNILGLGGLGLMACLQFLKVPWVWHLGDCIPSMLCSRWGVYDQAVPAIAGEFSRRFQGSYIAVSQQLRDQIETLGVMLGDDVELIPYWIVGSRPPARPPRAPKGPLRIMSAGQVTRGKGIDLLIEAVAQVRDAGIDSVTLDIYGEVDDPYFGAQIGALDLGAQVRLLGSRPQRVLLELYSEYDVFAFPTRGREPFGLVPLEAAARGCVPIISRTCGIAEWLVHGVHCLKVARTAGSFAALFRSIAAGEIDLEPIARRAAAAAWRDFHIDAILPRIEHKLARAAGQPRAGGGTSGEAYRLARMAEQLTQILVQEASPN